jgi:hypothetical protein
VRVQGLGIGGGHRGEEHVVDRRSDLAPRSHAPPGACWGGTAATEPQASAAAKPRALPGRDEVGMNTVAGLLAPMSLFQSCDVGSPRPSGGRLLGRHLSLLCCWDEGNNWCRGG